MTMTCIRCHHWFLLLLLLLLSSSSVIDASTVGPESVSKKDRLRGIFFGALVADALCLGSHFEYDAVAIQNAYSGKSMDQYRAPPGIPLSGTGQGGAETDNVDSDSSSSLRSQIHHPRAIAGDQTDYGEYNVLVLEHLHRIAPGEVSVSAFLPEWKNRIMLGDWKQRISAETRHVFVQLGTGTPVSQLGTEDSNTMALRYAAVFAYTDDERDVVDYAQMTMFTHRDRTALMGNEFFARVVYRILHHAMTPREAIEAVTKKMNQTFITDKVKLALDMVEEATNPDTDLFKDEFVDDIAVTSMATVWDSSTSQPIKVGKASSTEATLPGSIYFILKYQDDMIQAFKANAMIGGDNASRAIAIGMVLGAYHGIDAIDSKWRDTLNHWKYCETMLEALPLLGNVPFPSPHWSGAEL